MASILIVEKLGNIKATSLKLQNDEELYKKAGLKSNTDFKNHAIWEVEYDDKKYQIYLYGKTTGRANHENKYEFPPPVDKKLFFGNCILVNKDENNKYKNISVKEWEAIYEILYGGFEDLDDEDEDEEDEDEEDEIIDKTKITKQGYLKDGFLVDDDDDEDYDEDDEDDINEESDDNDDEKPVIVKNTKPKTVVKPKRKVEKKNEIKQVEENVVENEEMFLDCTSELSEDSYLE